MTLSARFEQALVYACIAHAGHLRKGTTVPYISHLLIVAGTAMEHGADEDEAVAALLHDAVEDAGGQPRLNDIRTRFGQRVADIVSGCTDTDVMPKPPFEERKRAYIDHLLHEENRSVLLVSASDKLANVRAILQDYREIGEELWKRFNGGRTGTLWYYRELANTFQKRGPARLALELSLAVTELDKLASDPART
jgi:(p)ppGpp synthase/HD superfamily hydrolase